MHSEPAHHCLPLPIMRFHRFVVLICAVAMARPALAQEPRQISIFLRAVDGYLAVDRVRTRPDMSRYAGPNTDVLRTLLDDIDVALRRIGRLCNQALHVPAEAECPVAANEIARLTQPDWRALRAAWTAWQQQAPDRRTLDSVFRDIENPIIQLGNEFPRVTALSFDAAPDTVDAEEGALVMMLLPPVPEWTVGSEPIEGKALIDRDTSQGAVLRNDDELRAALRPFVGGLWRPPAIEAAVEHLYPANRVLRSFNTPDDGFAVRIDQSRVIVREGPRLSQIGMSEALDDSLASRAFYLMLPYAEFSRVTGTRKLIYPKGQRPIISPEISDGRARLSEIGLTLNPEAEPGAEQVYALTVGRSSSVAPGALVHLEGGGVYRPEQGVHAVGRASLTRSGAKPQALTVGGGGTNSGVVGDVSYMRDFLFFDRLHRRVSVNVTGATESEYQRLLDSALTNERRWSARARADLEWIPDRRGTSLGFWVEGERTTVIVDRTDTHTDIAALNAGLQWGWRRQGLGLQRFVSVQPKLHGGVRVGGSPSFAVATVSTTFAQELGASVELHVGSHAAWASNGTPLVEQPVVGGAETIRGFRKDEVIGLHTWSVQNEVWLPFPLRRQLSALAWLRRNVRPATFVDVGGVTQQTQGVPGTRSAAGVGLRVQVTKGLFLKIDHGWGFGAGAQPPQAHWYVGADASH